MVKYCCAYGCKEKFVKGGSVSFHRFPKNQERRDLWEKNIHRENFKATDSSLICSKHFATDCFDKGKFGGTWLKSDAVPTIFEFPQHLQINTYKRRVLNKNDEEISSKPCKRLKYVGDFNEEVLDSPTKAKFALTVATETLNKKSKIIKTLRQKERRMQRKLKTFQEAIDYLKQKKFISNRTQEVLETTSGGNESQKVAETSIVIKQEPVESVDEPPRPVIKEIHGAEEIASSSSSLPFNNSSFSCDSISFHEKTLSLANHDSAIVDWSSAEHIVNKSARKRKIHDGEPVTPDANQDESCRVTEPSLPSKLTLSTVTSNKSKRTPNAKQAKSNRRTKPSMQSKRTSKPHPPVGTEKKSAGGSTLPTKNDENATREMLQCLLGCSQNNPVLGSRTTERPGDLFDVFADIIANKLREMDWDVCAYALKAILDIAFKADKASKEE